VDLRSTKEIDPEAFKNYIPPRPIPKPRIIPHGKYKIKRLKIPQNMNFSKNGTYIFAEFPALN
jgi:hypothetical protein